jgi:hypothetical protein
LPARSASNRRGARSPQRGRCFPWIDRRFCERPYSHFACSRAGVASDVARSGVCAPIALVPGTDRRCEQTKKKAPVRRDPRAAVIATSPAGRRREPRAAPSPSACLASTARARSHAREHGARPRSRSSGPPTACARSGRPPSASSSRYSPSVAGCPDARRRSRVRRRFAGARGRARARGGERCSTSRTNVEGVVAGELIRRSGRPEPPRSKRRRPIGVAAAATRWRRWKRDARRGRASRASFDDTRDQAYGGALPAPRVAERTRSSLADCTTPSRARAALVPSA